MLKRVSSSWSFQRSKVEWPAIKGMRDAFDNARGHWDGQIMDVSMSNEGGLWCSSVYGLSTMEEEEAVDGSNKDVSSRKRVYMQITGGEQA
jgi:hypothetical protein